MTTMTNTASAIQETQVREQLGRLSNAVDQLHKQISELENRFHIVLRAKDETCDEDKAVGTLVPLAEELMGYADRVEYANELLGRMLARCEL